MESISNVAMRDSFETMHPPEEKRRCKARVKEPDTLMPYARRLWAVGVFLLLLARESRKGRRDSHGVAWWLMDGWEVIVVDIYSCHRR